MSLPPPEAPRLSVRATATANGAQITIPASVQPGDQMLLFSGSYATTYGSMPAGWTTYYQGAATGGNYSDSYVALHRVATAGDAGAVATVTGSRSDYGGLVLVALYNQDTASPFVDSNLWSGKAGPTSGPIQTGVISGVRVHRRVVFVTQMSDATAVPTFGTPNYSALLATVAGASGNHRVSAYISYRTGTGTQPSSNITTSGEGSAAGLAWAIADADQSAEAGQEFPVSPVENLDHTVLFDRLFPVPVGYDGASVDHNIVHFDRKFPLVTVLDGVTTSRPTTGVLWPLR